MAGYQKIIVERKHPGDVRSRYLAEELRSALNLRNLQSLRILCQYEISGIQSAGLFSAAAGLLYELNSDYAAVELPPPGKDETVISRELLPGQFDQRADSAGRGLRLIYPDCRIEVRRSDIFILKGRFSAEDEKKIRKWLINPVESREKNLGSSSLNDEVP